jgi:hypothetical protein
MRAALAVALVVLGVAHCLAQEAPIPVSGLETTDGLSITWDPKNPDSKLTLNTDPQWVSEGKGSVFLRSKSLPDARGNSYVGFSMRLTEPLALEKRSLKFEAWSEPDAAPRALYVRGYDAANKTVLSWQTWNWGASGATTVELIPEMSYSGLDWESEVAVSAERKGIVRLEFIIGTSEKGVAYGMYFDNVRTDACSVVPWGNIGQAKPLFLRTQLEAGKSFILCPDGEAWAAVAGELAAAVKAKCGLELPVRAASTVTDEELRGACTVALGTVSNNRRLLYLYAHGYTYADDLYPGPDGYVVQSIHDPWGSGKNVLLVGASTPEGARQGMAKLVSALDAAGAAGPLFAANLTGIAQSRWGSTLTREPDEKYQADQRAAAEKALVEGAHTGLFSQIANVGSLYAQSRKDGYATLFAWLVRRAKTHRDGNPTTYGGPWGMDSDFCVYRVLPMWDQVEESPALSDADRLDVAKILFQWTSEVAPSKARGAMGNERVRFNHQTFPALGCMFAGEYFSKYYHAAEARGWLQIADGCFQMQAKAFKANEDCNGYQWLTLYHMMTYALARPDFTLFENGNARRCADYAIISMDNLGYSVTYGDTGAYVGWWSEMPFLMGAFWYYRDPRYAWTLAYKKQVSGRYSLGEFNVDLEGAPPADLTGMIAWPLDPFYYRTFGGPTKVAEEHAVDKVVFREGFDPQQQYMLLDGLSNGGHKHLDGNGISRWSQNGRIWLADADYILSLPKYHNGVLIFRNGQSQQIPEFCELEHAVDLPSFGASTTTFRNYAGVDWRRHVLWQKGGWFLVGDEMVAKEDGDYSFRVVWNTIGEVTLTPGGLQIHQDGQYAQIAVPADCRLTLDNDADYGKNWSGYKYIKEPVVRVLRCIYDRQLKAGQRAVLFSLLYASGDKPADLRMARTYDSSVVISGLPEPVQATVGNVRWQLSTGSARGAADDRAVFEVNADGCVVTPQKVFAVAATSATGLGPEVGEGGADIEYNLNEGKGLRVEPARTTAAMPPAPREVSGASLPVDRVRAALQAIVETVPAQARPAAAAIEAPVQLPVLWQYRETPTSFLLTGNRGATEAVDVGTRITVSPEPLAQNVFSGGANGVEKLTNGGVQSTDDCVMWGDDQTVTVQVDLDGEYKMDNVALDAWFVSSSSKGKKFQLGSLVAEASNDGFAADVRKVAELTDTADHPNWGDPAHEPCKYVVDLHGTRAKSLRLRLAPRPGTGLYLAELQIAGSGEELAARLLARKGANPRAFESVLPVDLDGDGKLEVLAGGKDGRVLCFDAAGAARWALDCGGAVHALAAVDFEGNGKPTVIAGCHGARAVAISAAGQKLWQFDVPYYKRLGHVRVAFAADLQGTGKQTAIIGAENWHFYALDANGKELWKYESVHGSTCGASADLDGDRKQEVVAGTEYYWWHAIRPDGKQLWGYSVQGPHANAATTANLDGNKSRCVVFGGADGNVHVLGPDGKVRWLFNTGDEITAVAARDVDGDGSDEIIAASMNFNVFALKADGSVLWRRDLGSQVTRLALAGPWAAVTTQAGSLWVLDCRDGRVTGGAKLPSAPLSIAAPSGNDGGGLVVTCEDGSLLWLGMP